MCAVTIEVRRLADNSSPRAVREVYEQEVVGKPKCHHHQHYATLPP